MPGSFFGRDSIRSSSYPTPAASPMPTISPVFSETVSASTLGNMPARKEMSRFPDRRKTSSMFCNEFQLFFFVFDLSIYCIFSLNGI